MNKEADAKKVCERPLQDELKFREKLPGIIENIVGSCQQETDIQHLDATVMPSRDEIVRLLDLLKSLLFPGYVGRSALESHNLVYYVGELVNSIFDGLSVQIERAIRHECLRKNYDHCVDCYDHSREETVTFLGKIPKIRSVLSRDVRAAYEGDPAAKSFDEIIFSYPGIQAISIYRLAHELFLQGVPIVPRIMTEHAHQVTGIDIHPGAKIGPGFFIDHGTGVVIGETTEIGTNVQIYQGVTLGALRMQKDADGRIVRGQKRHPDIEDGVTIYSGATILGGETRIGKGSTVGGNLWLTESVPTDTIAMLEPGKITYMTKGSRGS